MSKRPNKDEIIKFRITQADREMIKNKAEGMGISTSAFIRIAIYNYLQRGR